MTAILLLLGLTVGGTVIAVELLLAEMRRRQRGLEETALHAVHDEALWQFIARSLEAHSAEAVVREVSVALTQGLSMDNTVLLEPGEDGWIARRLDSEQPLPAPRSQNVFAWFRHNPDMVLVSDLADGRYGGMRLPLEELGRTYGADVLLPLAHHGQLIAVVAAGGLGRPLEAAERGLLGQLYQTAAAAAANARLHREVALKASLQHEVDAANIVRAVLEPPTTLQHLGGTTLALHCRQERETASLVFAATEHPGGVTLVVGDVVGHGVSASMLVSVAKGCCEAAAGVDVGELLTILNAAIYRPGPDRPEIRCVAVSIDPTDRSLRAAGAGAPFPYVISRHDGKTIIDSVIARGPLLGDLPEASFQVVSRELQPEETLILTSAGLHALENAERVPYGERRLVRALRGAAAHEPAWVIDELAADLERHTGHAALSDQILVVAARPE